MFIIPRHIGDKMQKAPIFSVPQLLDFYIGQYSFLMYSAAATACGYSIKEMGGDGNRDLQDVPQEGQDMRKKSERCPLEGGHDAGRVIET